MEKQKLCMRRRIAIYTAVFLIINVFAIALLAQKETASVNESLLSHAQDTENEFNDIMGNYERSFRIFVEMMKRELEHNPDPENMWNYLKGMDSLLLDIEGETFDGLYMYYMGRYIYSWDTPYSEYEKTGYDATERPWYKDAVKGNGGIVFTPPYMSYANHYILTTISQLQPDRETVFAYDIKMGAIQELVSSLNKYDSEQVMIFDESGTVIGSTEPDYLGGNLYRSVEESLMAVKEAEKELEAVDSSDTDAIEKIKDRIQYADEFSKFRMDFDEGFTKLCGRKNIPTIITVNNTKYYGLLTENGKFGFLVLVPFMSAAKATLSIWLVPLLAIELLLVYIFGRITKDQKNRELKAAYIELGQIQNRLEIALSAAQKAAAVDDLTGMMNFKSFRKSMIDILREMEEKDSGILIMIDGDKFKYINDNYGHGVGDEVIKLSAQMIVGRIRTNDIASRLHGDEFAIFVSDASDYSIARRIMEDINKTIAKEAKRRNMPSITLSSGAVIARRGDSYLELSKAADTALYEAKKTHNGAFAFADKNFDKTDSGK
ncbi:diguanylate cyclase [Lachnospiraceae bacterium NSJ-143]|nr:diguanylate cyclase [Lachnospiraceae bacterium NSJ-143]